MTKFVIQGGKPLRGIVEIQGAKNAALPLLAATVLTDAPCTLRNLPRIADVNVLVDILANMGADVHWHDDKTVTICCANVSLDRIDRDKIRKLRASVLLLGPLSRRFPQISLPYPGGCVLGKRSLDAHFFGLRELGAVVEEAANDFSVDSRKLLPTRITLPEASVTATENLMMAAAGIAGTTVIRNAACEPHVDNLGEALVQMGVTIAGTGSHFLSVRGSRSLAGFDVRVIPDQLEVGSFAVAAALGMGEVILQDVIEDHLDPVLLKLKEAGVPFRLENHNLIITAQADYRSFNLTTNIWPGFPSDLQAPFTVLATQCHGSSMIHDWMYEGRLFYTDKLVKMGANIVMCDPHRVVVMGPAKLHAKEIESPDIRAGMALVIAALAAEGTSVIDHVELIDRGYLNIEQRLGALGAQIERV